MKKRSWLFVFTVLLLGISLSAPAFAADEVTIRMSWWGGDSRHKATVAALKKFQEKYPHIKVKAEYTGWSGHLEKLTTQIAGGTEADLMQVNWNWLSIFSKRGTGFADLNNFKDIIDLSQWDETLLTAGTMGNNLNGLPVSATGRVFFLNKTTYQKAGIEVPKTWDELIASAASFRENLGQGYFPFDATDLNGWLMTVLVATQQTGKSFIDPDTSKVAWTKEELVKALTFYQNLVDKGVLKSMKAAASEGEVKLHEKKEWMEGKLAGSYEWDSTFFKYSKVIKEGELIPVPTLMTKNAVSEGMFRKPSMTFAISKNSKHPKEAAMLLNFLLNEPEGIIALGATRGIPANKKAEALLAKEKLIAPELLAAHEIIVNGEAPRISPYFEHFKLQDLYRGTMEEIAYNKISIDEAAEKFIREGNRILKRLSK
ncbi:MAG: ABC transporter substrate-binding protein [Desulfobacteraceae bacterium]|jgi:oligogalacturonide transport system substrate-binding protein